MEKIEFTLSDTEEAAAFFVLEETRINKVNYLLVTESEDEDEDAEAYILKEVSEENAPEACYEIVEDDKELSYVSKIFAELLEDVDIEL